MCLFQDMGTLWRFELSPVLQCYLCCVAISLVVLHVFIRNFNFVAPKLLGDSLKLLLNNLDTFFRLRDNATLDFLRNCDNRNKRAEAYPMTNTRGKKVIACGSVLRPVKPVLSASVGNGFRAIPRCQ